MSTATAATPTPETQTKQPPPSRGKFKKASREQSRLRMAIDGPSGAGKTYTALAFAHVLSPTNNILVIDTEHGSAAKYLGENKWDFYHENLKSFSPSEYTANIEEAGRQGFDVIVIDSLSHAWEGKDGALELVDRSNAKNSFTAWKDVTPMHRSMVEAILASPCHVICTMRTKMEYVLEEDANGKKIPKKIGMAPVQRAGMEYEFDIVLDMDHNHIATVSKTRCRAIDGKSVVKPGEGFIAPVIDWLKTGAAVEISPPPMRVRHEQLEAINTIANQMGWRTSKVEQALVKQDFGIKALADLTEMQATKFLSWLEGQKRVLDQKVAADRARAQAQNPQATQANGQHQSATPPTQGTPTSPAQVSTDLNHNFARREQIDQVVAVVKAIQDRSEYKAGKLPDGNVFPVDFYQRALVKRGVDNVNKLTIAQADELITALGNFLKKLEADAADAGNPTPAPETSTEPNRPN